MDADLDGLIGAGTRLLGVPVQPEWMPEIRRHLRTVLAAGLLVAELKLPDESEPAAVFVA